MKSLALCISILLIGFVSKAQTSMASLNITLTDVQSVTFSNASLDETDPLKKVISQSGALRVLSNSTSQIKIINSTNLEYETRNKEFYAGKANKGLAINTTSSAKRPRNSNSSNLIIYQIDPR